MNLQEGPPQSLLKINNSLSKNNKKSEQKHGKQLQRTRKCHRTPETLHLFRKNLFLFFFSDYLNWEAPKKLSKKHNSCMTILIQYLMLQNSPILLIYLDFKGMAHVARHLLCYLNLPFVDILLDKLEEQRKTLHPSIFQILKGVKIDKTMLPILIHEGNIVEELFPIMTYLCYRFEREDLIGKDCYQKARVQELMEIYINSLPHTQSLLFELADTAAVIEEENLLPTIEAYYKKVLRESDYMKQLCDFIIHEGNGQFILGNITILDFYFVESSNYMLGLFGSLDKQIANAHWKPKSEKYGKKVRGASYLKVMKNYHVLMKSLPYYQEHENYLESFCLIGSLMGTGRAKGFRRIWAIEMSQVI